MREKANLTTNFYGLQDSTELPWDQSVQVGSQDIWWASQLVGVTVGGRHSWWASQLVGSHSWRGVTVGGESPKPFGNQLSSFNSPRRSPLTVVVWKLLPRPGWLSSSKKIESTLTKSRQMVLPPRTRTDHGRPYRGAIVTKPSSPMATKPRSCMANKTRRDTAAGRHRREVNSSKGSGPESASSVKAARIVMPTPEPLEPMRSPILRAAAGVKCGSEVQNQWSETEATTVHARPKASTRRLDGLSAEILHENTLFRSRSVQLNRHGGTHHD